MTWLRLPSNFWSAVITSVVMLHYPDLINLRAIGAAIDVLIPHEKRVKSRKLAPRTEPGRLLATLVQSPATAKNDLIDIFTSLNPTDLADLTGPTSPAGPTGPTNPTSPTNPTGLTDLFP
ncbi:uncharacterized protein UV8b_03325 [Ustilaginoidea virens]|uniref:Uncharacterized protein n=1 Tax=Ustilaginoidea virens TaxID=1159556 RepID=A0A8E5HP50_USTVR|nr:uncharacterized protein UV8b_03325 [Ustilaginoidea virens]QUC19084.1 hypothetical protein UV8b_03325 [Ustilaginoidea virens]